ncbi:unnamed protein product [Prunus armeniaca]
MTTAQSSPPPAQPSSAATAPELMDHFPVALGGSQAPVLSESSMAQPVSARRRHRPASTTDTTSTDATGASRSQLAKKNTRGSCRQLKNAKVTRVTNSRINIGYDEQHWAATTAELHSSLAHDISHVVRTHCPMQWKSWKVMPDEIKTEVRGQLSMNYNLEDLDDESLTYVNRLFAKRDKQWKSNLHHHFEAFDDPQNKAKADKGNRNKKTLLHHSSFRPFSYRMDAWRQGGSKFPEIDVFGDVYVRLGNKLVETLHSVDPPQDAGFQILTETLDQTHGRRPGTYCQGMENARRREPRPRSSSQANSQVTALTAKVAELQGQMSVILESLARPTFQSRNLLRRPPSPSTPPSMATRPLPLWTMSRPPSHICGGYDSDGGRGGGGDGGSSGGEGGGGSSGGEGSGGGGW